MLEIQLISTIEKGGCGIRRNGRKVKRQTARIFDLTLPLLTVMPGKQSGEVGMRRDASISRSSAPKSRTHGRGTTWKTRRKPAFTACVSSTRSRNATKNVLLGANASAGSRFRRNRRMNLTSFRSKFGGSPHICLSVGRRSCWLCTRFSNHLVEGSLVVAASLPVFSSCCYLFFSPT